VMYGKSSAIGVVSVTTIRRVSNLSGWWFPWPIPND